ncbi:MAG: hypothetical protein WAM82_22690 [Thermoanaerobaculia bacterium]
MKARIGTELVLLVVPMLASCSLGPERWEPHVVNVSYARSGQGGELDLGRTAPTLVIDAGEKLELLSFQLRLLPTRRSSSGVIIAKAKELPPVPPSALELKVRVAATMRKWEGSGSCYDNRDQLLTDWVPVQAERWELRLPQNSWIVGKDWDEIRIDVHIRRGPGPEPEAEYTINSIELQPTLDRERLRRNVRRNIFMRAFESLRGEQFCVDSRTLGRKSPSLRVEMRSSTGKSQRLPRQSTALTWIAVALLGVGNVYIARRIAIWGLSRDVIGRQSWKAAVLFLLLWCAGWGVLYHANGIELTFTQAIILAFCIALSYQWHRKSYAMPLPREGWGPRLNQRIRPVMRIAERHGWDVSGPEAARALAESGKLHFDGADYDVLASAESDEGHKRRQQMDVLITRTASREIDYDVECAQWIVSLARYLNGSEDRLGMVERVPREHNLSGFDEASYQRLLWLTEALLRDRGWNGLYRRAEDNDVI